MNYLPIHDFFVPGKIEWNWYGFGAFSVNDPNMAKFSAWGIPYWFFVAPLTLLAAILLLSKPRNSRDAAIGASSDPT